MKIQRFDADDCTPLYEYSAWHHEPYPLMVRVSEDELEITTGRLQGDNRPMNEFLGLVRTFSGLPANLSGRQLAELADELEPHARVLAAGIERVWDGENTVGRVLGEAKVAEEEIESIVDRWRSAAGEYDVVRAELWDVDEEMAEAAATTDLALQALEERYAAEALEQRTIIDDLGSYLRRAREQRTAEAA